jgi:DNA-binding NarL/FixJ family response regulator
MREVVAGQRYLSPAVFEASNGSFTAMGTILQKTQTDSLDAYNRLTVRERKVLRLVVEGASSSDIGSRLKISSRRVESDRANCKRKLGLSLPEDLITYALQRGSLAGDEPKSIRKSR